MTEHRAEYDVPSTNPPELRDALVMAVRMRRWGWTVELPTGGQVCTGTCKDGIRCVPLNQIIPPACKCEAYTIRTDYGTGVEHEVDRSSCPIHGGPTACEHGIFGSHWVGRDGDTPEWECVSPSRGES